MTGRSTTMARAPAGWELSLVDLDGQRNIAARVARLIENRVLPSAVRGVILAGRVRLLGPFGLVIQRLLRRRSRSAQYFANDRLRQLAGTPGVLAGKR